MGNKPELEIRIKRSEFQALVTVFWTNRPYTPEGAYTSKHFRPNSRSDLLQRSKECVLDMLCDYYGNDGPRGLYGWRGVYYTMQHHINRQLQALIKGYYNEQD